MGKESQAREAIAGLNNSEFNGSKISVEMARPKRNEGGGMYDTLFTQYKVRIYFFTQYFCQ